MSRSQSTMTIWVRTRYSHPLHEQTALTPTDNSTVPADRETDRRAQCVNQWLVNLQCGRGFRHRHPPPEARSAASRMSPTGIPRFEVPPEVASTRFASLQLGAPLLLEPLVMPRAKVPETMAPPLSPARVHAVPANPRTVRESPSAMTS